MGGVFRPSYYHDNYLKPHSKSSTRLRRSGDSFFSSHVNFSTFLNDREQMPRLSILENYGQIMRIMTQNYIKSVEFEKRYHHIDKQEVKGDEEYVKFREEEDNANKMSCILKNLNSPMRIKTASNFLRKRHSTVLD